MRDLLLMVLLGGIAYAAWSLWRESREGADGIHPALIEAARGDKELAQRTLTYLRTKYPEKSEQWRREKAIYDLHRDHGSTSGGSRRRNPTSMSRRERHHNRGFTGLMSALRSFFNRFRRR